MNYAERNLVKAHKTFIVRNGMKYWETDERVLISWWENQINFSIKTSSDSSE